jgi:two-component system, OmpR family, alkaline phosphatase synthesis response regulator PhoP
MLLPTPHRPRRPLVPKLLIADDEPHIRTLLTQTLEVLEDDGVELFVEADGAAALDRIRSERPDVAFLDVMMPKMNGFDVCAAVRADPDLAHVLVVLLTAKGQEVDRQKGADAGATLYLTKPFDPDALLETAERLLGLG